MNVRTASDFKMSVRGGDIEYVESTDAVTFATMGLMESVSAELSIALPDDIPSGFVDCVSLNGVPAVPDMVRDGHLDCTIAEGSARDNRYGAGHLYRDIASGKSIHVEFVMDDRTYLIDVTKSDMPRAIMTALYDTAASTKAFVNKADRTMPAMYSGPGGLFGNMLACSVIGCGEIEPLFNHRGNSSLKVGDRVLLNAALGEVIRTGDDGDENNRFIQVRGDIHDMNPRYMGGFITPYGPVCVISIATAMMIDHENMPRELVVSDMGIPLPIVNRDNMVPIHWSSYGDVWPRSTGFSIDRSRCHGCETCAAETSCPMEAGPLNGPDYDLCLSCGSCVFNCKADVFSGELGWVVAGSNIVPVSIRLSSRNKAEELCILAKKRIDEFIR